MKNFLTSAFVLLLGTGAAFATKSAKKTAVSTVPAYHYDIANNLCVDAEQDCSNVFSTQPCKWSDGSTLREFDNPTMCGNLLYKKEPITPQ